MSDSGGLGDLEARVARLERLVEDLVGRARDSPAPSRPASPPHRAEAETAGSGAGPRRAPGPAKGARPTLAGTGEQWLGRIGVGFLLIALSFLLKYSFDQGWITPTLRLVMGVVLGGLLLVVGLRLEGPRRRYSQFLMGGAIGTFYLVGFAGYQLYELIPYVPAFSFMITVTLLAFVLSIRQDHPALAVIGASGGLATPFALSTGGGSVPGLVAYTSVILIGAGAVQLVRGWWSLRATLVLGGFSALAAAVFAVGGGEQWIVTMGLLVYWGIGGLAPLLPPPGSRSEGPSDPQLAPRSKDWLTRLCIGWTVGTAAAMAAGLWDASQRQAGIIFLGFGVVHVALACLGPLRERSRPHSAEVGALAVAMGTWLAVGGSWALLLVAGEVAVLHAVARRSGWHSLTSLGHGLLVVVAVVFINQAAAYWPRDGVFRDAAFLRLGVVALTLAVSFLVDPAWRMAYRLCAHVGLLLWFLAELSPLANGAALVSIAWGLQGALVLVWAFRLGERRPQLLGLGTLGLVAGKMLLFDMAQLDVFWRILLFFGIGAAFLGLSYWINRPGRSTQEA